MPQQPRRALKNCHLREFPVWEVLPYTQGDHPVERVYIVNDIRYKVSMRSTRFDLFIKSNICACCGLAGDKMILDIHRGHVKPHFNLYGRRDGKLVLFTRDHINPKSKGGPNHLENYQTMCERCNRRKKNRHISMQALLKEISQQGVVDLRTQCDSIDNTAPLFKKKKKVKHRKSKKRIVARKERIRLRYHRLIQGVGFYISEGRGGTPAPTFADCVDMVRERAYQLWEAAGRPWGRETEFWTAAEHDLFVGGYRGGYKTNICNMSDKKNRGFYRIYEVVMIHDPAISSS